MLMMMLLLLLVVVVVVIVVIDPRLLLDVRLPTAAVAVAEADIAGVDDNVDNMGLPEE